MNRCIKRGCHEVGHYVRKNSPAILTGLSIVGTAATAVMAVKATPKAIQILEEQEEFKQERYGEPLTKFEKALVLTPVYLPSFLMGLGTVGCILGAHKINKERQVMLTSAYSFLNANFNEYKNKVKELYGEESERKVRESISKDNLDMTVISEDELSIYDEFGGRHFTIKPSDFQDALYKLNRMYNFTGEMTLNNFYEFFGLDPIPGGDLLGWSALKDFECTGISWIDVTLEKIDMIDDYECFAMKYNVEPADDFGCWTMP